MGLLVAPLLTRWVCLWQIPDIAVPFEVESVVYDDIPPDDDAFVKYAEIVSKLRQHPIGTYALTFEIADDKRDGDWERSFNQWLIDRRDILAEYQSAGAMPRAKGPSLRTATYNTLLPVHQDLRNLVKFAEAQAELFERQGDLDQAWACHLAALRSGNHADKPGLAICCFTGSAIHSVAFDGIVRWASNPALTASRLKAARLDLVESLRGRITALESAKAEFLILRNSLRDASGPEMILPSQFTSGRFLSVKRMLLWSIGEPELTLRLERQLLVNTASQLDMPRHLRQPELGSRRLVFALAPNAKLELRQMNPAALAPACQGIFPLYSLRQLSPADRTIDKVRQRAQAKGVMMIALLAAEEFHRIHGAFPEALSDLVPNFLDDIPFDPIDTNGTSIRYRREANGDAIIWSIGDNNLDDNGSIAGKSPADIGYHIQVKSPEDVASEQAVPSEEK